MAWLHRTRQKDGTVIFWIRDVRDGVQIVINTWAANPREAEMKLEQYEIRKDLEKEGYDDTYSLNQQMED